MNKVESLKNRWSELNPVDNISTQIPHEHAFNFILSGKAHFIIMNGLSGERWEYKINRTKIWYNGLQLGTIKNNEEDEPNLIMPRLVSNDINIREARAAILYILHNLINNHCKLKPTDIIYHLGQCGKCGRTLKDPISIQLGIGPICRGEKS